MFWFTRNKPLNVHFVTAREEVFNFSKPKPATSFIPNWFKDLSKSNVSYWTEQLLPKHESLRTCNGFIELYKSGFMIPLWSDLNVEIGPEYAFKYSFADRNSEIIVHNKNQFGGCHFAHSHIGLKLTNPWHVKMDAPANLVFTAPAWNAFGYDDVVVAPGAFSPHPYPIKPNINLLFKRREVPVMYELPMGQPLVHIIPMTDKPVKLHYELVSEKEFDAHMRKNPMYCMFKNRFNRAQKICPHGH